SKLKVFNSAPGGFNATFVGSAYGYMPLDCGFLISMHPLPGERTPHLFQVMNTAIENSRSFFQESRDLIEVYAYDSDGSSYYSPGNDHIVIYHKDDNNTHIAGDYGDFVAAHEYGHALHEKGLGGNNGGYCSQDDDDNDGHYVFEPISLRCAFSEGFADYHAAEVGFPYFQFEANPYVSNGEDGSIIEGAVAGFFWDLTDPTNESFDNVEYNSGYYIASIIEDCEVKVNGNWKRADGIDHLIACFQHGVPSYTSYFPTRNNYPTTYQEN